MNNQTNKIVNLSHLILNKIISYIDDNIDIICFSLVCKRWFNDRDKYLIFKTKNIHLFKLNSTDIQNHKHFNLPSYHNIFMKSIQSKSDNSLFIGSKNYHHYDYHFDDVRKINSIPSNVTIINTAINFLFEGDMEYLYRLISESQSVTTLKGCRTLKYGLPKSIKSITFHNFNEPLVKGSLPNTLEVLDFGDSYFKQEILPGVLPDGLQELTLHKYQYVIQPCVLPVSLRKLSLHSSQFDILPGVLPVGLLKCILGSYNFGIKPDVLPDGLLEFSLEGSDCYQYEIQPRVFPLSLEYLCFESYNPSDELAIPPPNREDLEYSAKSLLPISWLQAISSLSNLQSLFVYFPYHDRDDTTIFNVNYLPSSLKSFGLIVPGTTMGGIMPTSLKKIDIDECQFKIDEIFPETKQYHLESMEYENNIIHPIPSNVSIDEFIIRGKSNEPKITLPSGVGKIRFLIDWTNPKEKIMDFGGDGATDQTCSLRELHFVFDFEDEFPQVKLPNTIELLDLGTNNLNTTLHLVPSSVKTLIFKNQSKINITIPNTIKSITNIIGKFGLIYTQTIRKLDEYYYLLYGNHENKGNSGNLVARIFHHSKLEQILGTKIE
ncbi:hypothetical protein PPL_10886 [Heterostelium album PN500]|uniref:FNIP repeat-containing protein n=1 Tax=Heterostelium pallidum (strain ATCC 26659 / Pp 5 / PN500) TaxID=670386 RepID=D3BS94_HETP5|nr:hypothetical protein PPL_10886 [Heterostelium album PN500]EFA75831.1 hypothetical protein PPL_10886 [Heterostelium album PN500]|eukprot:XP_020427965.1 hypothetical protein PPL_10886 [Heterostelium album PN500]